MIHMCNKCNKVAVVIEGEYAYCSECYYKVYEKELNKFFSTLGSISND